MPYVTTNDGVSLFYQESGVGQPVVIIPGLCQTARLFARQLAGLSARNRVIVYDHRGHGESGKPAHGYRVARLAKDLDDLLDALGLSDVTLLGWSLGCSVAWSYYELFGPQRLRRLILVDGTVLLRRTPQMTDAEATDTGAAYDATGLDAFVTEVLCDQEGVLRRLTSVFSTDPGTDREWLLREFMKTPAPVAAALLSDYAVGDWRALIPRIALPTLVIGADRSHIPLSVQRWLHRTIPESRLAIMRDRAHLMFYEEPDTFNRLVTDFIDQTAPSSR